MSVGQSMEATSLPPFLTVKEAADFLGLKKQTLDAWRCHKRHGLPFVRVGGRIRYSREALLRWIENRTASGDSQNV